MGGVTTNPQSTLIAGNLIAFFVCLPLALPAPTFRATDVATIGYLGIVQIAMAYLFFLRGIRDVPALEASFYILLEPVLNPVFTWIFHGETPGRWAVAGATVLLATIAVRSVLSARESPPALASPD
jgi:drug/metabolite transporter (DMT)-like permease